MPGNLRIDHAHPAVLLNAVDDELGADHARVGVGFVAEIAIAPGARPVGVGLGGFAGVKGVGRGMDADEALAVFDGIEKRIFARGDIGGFPSFPAASRSPLV